MEVDFGGGDGFVAEHFLDGAQVGSSFEEVGGEGVAEGVWGYFFCYTGGGCQVADDVEYHYAGHLGTAAVEEEDVAAVGLYLELLACGKVFFDEIAGNGGNGDYPLLVAFACDNQKAFVEIEAGDAEIGEFGDPQSAAV